MVLVYGESNDVVHCLMALCHQDDDINLSGDVILSQDSLGL